MKLRWCAGLLLFLFWLLIPLPAAQAHAGLVSSTPSAGEQLAALPSQVRLEFEEDLLAIGGTKTNILTVTDSQGNEIDVKNSKLDGRILSVGIKPLNMTGKFTVNWRVVSGDGHPIQGSFQFEVSSVGSPLASSSPTADKTPEAILSKTVSEENIWQRYGSRILVLIAFLIAFSIWIGFKRMEVRARLKN